MPPSELRRDRESVTALHAEEVASFSRAGDWLSAEERSAVVRRARARRAAHGLQPAADDSAAADPDAVLPDALLELIDRLALEPAAFTRDDRDRAAAAGIDDGEYVETVGLVARAVNVDVFARALGHPPAALAAPDGAEAGGERAAGITDEGAWVPTLPGGAAGGAAAQALYGGAAMPFIYRALSLAPAEAARVIGAGNLQYLTLDRFAAFDYSPWPGLGRAQIEAIAARVSAANACFY